MNQSVNVETKRVIRIVVASPSDVPEERAAITQIVAEINRTVGHRQGTLFEIFRWDTNVYPGFHACGPQGRIDDQLKIGECDVLLGVFWRRIGTLTPDGKTGTEHEIGLAYESWKKRSKPEIMLYFSQKPACPASIEEHDQWKSVTKLKERFAQEMLWAEYEDLNHFKELVRTHLTQYLFEKTPTYTISQLRRAFGSLYEKWDLSNIGVNQSDGSRRPLTANLEDIYLPLRLGN